MTFPSPPWALRGDLWLSLFPVRSVGTALRSPGLYGVAFVDYQEGGVLTYQELLVARLVRDGPVPRVSITDIWVNSTPSRDGGRSLWAIPKELADLHVDDRRRGPVASTSWSANDAGSPIAAARFTGLHRPALRLPFAFSTTQQRDGRPVVTKVTGSARSLPCVARWDFGIDGPLAWLHGRQAVLSLRMSAFRLTFGS
ncbi:MAG TPA: acetoacetate decarboxylase family protein [Nocardioidaceae bacterium]|nr:acetoacetate decarboxylase family protein [Nocardioidaceae bacterium]